MSGGQLKRVKLSNILMHLRKCSNHPYLFPDTEPAFDNPDIEVRCPHSLPLVCSSWELLASTAVSSAPTALLEALAPLFLSP